MLVGSQHLTGAIDYTGDTYNEIGEMYEKQVRLILLMIIGLIFIVLSVIFVSNMPQRCKYIRPGTYSVCLSVCLIVCS